MRVLMIGSGGREHALCWKMKQSPLLTQLYCAPGNAGIADVAECVSLAVEDHAAVIGWCGEKAIDLVVIGPEAPLVAGLADDLRAAGIACFGPDKAAAALEGSKAFTKYICTKYKVPTAAYGSFDTVESALAYARAQGAPIVVKADGLAAGKGVVVAQTLAEAEQAIQECFSGKFGEAGRSLVIEDCLIGEELSFFALVDGDKAVELGSAQDHKAVGEGDTGPNTGGMGTYAPCPRVTPELSHQVMETIVLPIARGMVQEGKPYRGVLFVGLMLTATGPQVIEFNVRFGDPETQVLMLRIDEDILPLLAGVAKGELPSRAVKISPKAALCVVMAANGYPDAYQKGTVIRGTEALAGMQDVMLFHAGTSQKDGKIVATGGRVLGVCATGDALAQAQAKAYQAVDAIDWPEGFCRRDIGWRALKAA